MGPELLVSHDRSRGYIPCGPCVLFRSVAFGFLLVLVFGGKSQDTKNMFKLDVLVVAVWNDFFGRCSNMFFLHMFDVKLMRMWSPAERVEDKI